MNIKRTYGLIYSIVTIILAIYIIVSPIASVSETIISGSHHTEYWFSINELPNGTNLKILVIAAPVSLLIFIIVSIITDNNLYLNSGCATSTLLYTIAAFAINNSISSYGDQRTLVINEHGVGWHMLLIVMIINTVQLGIALLITKKNNKL